MRIQVTRRLLFMALAVVLLVGALPLASAYEAHVVDIRAAVQQPPTISKTIRLANCNEAQLVGNPPNPSGVKNPFYIPYETRITWVETIVVYNPYTYPLTNVVVRDQWGAELAARPINTSAPALIPINTGQCSLSNSTFEKDYSLTWYATYISGNVSLPNTVMNSGRIQPNQRISLDILVWTKYNPDGQCLGCTPATQYFWKYQGYTSPGKYGFDTSLTAKWKDPQRVQHGTGYPAVYVTAYSSK
jgi:hypothetical protein